MVLHFCDVAERGWARQAEATFNSKAECFVVGFFFFFPVVLAESLTELLYPGDVCGE